MPEEPRRTVAPEAEKADQDDEVEVEVPDSAADQDAEVEVEVAVHEVEADPDAEVAVEVPEAGADQDAEVAKQEAEDGEISEPGSVESKSPSPEGDEPDDEENEDFEVKGECSEAENDSSKDADAEGECPEAEKLAASRSKGGRVLTPHSSNEEAPPKKAAKAAASKEDPEDPESQIQMLLAKKDYAGAAALQRAASGRADHGVEEDKDADAKEEGSEAEKLAASRSKGARVLTPHSSNEEAPPKKAAKAAASKEDPEDPESQIQMLLAKKDYKGAAALQEQCKKRAASGREDHGVEEDKDSICASPEVSRSKGARVSTPHTSCKEAPPKKVARVAAPKQDAKDPESQIRMLVAEKDYAGAAAVQASQSSVQAVCKERRVLPREVASKSAALGEKRSPQEAQITDIKKQAEAQIQELVAMRNFAGAAAAQEECNRAVQEHRSLQVAAAAPKVPSKSAGHKEMPAPAQARRKAEPVAPKRPVATPQSAHGANTVTPKNLSAAAAAEEKIQKCVAKRDFAGAAAAHEEAQKLAPTEQSVLDDLDEFEADIQKCIAEKDFRGAAALEQLRKTKEAEIHENVASRLRAMEAAREVKLKELVDKQDYQGAADLESNTKQLQLGVRHCMTHHDYAGATTLLSSALAATPAELPNSLDRSKARHTGRDAATARANQELTQEHRGNTGGMKLHPPEETTCADLFRTDIPLPERVILRSARVLSSGIVCEVPKKGKSKDKGKSKSGKLDHNSAKGKGKGKGQEQGKGKAAPQLGEGKGRVLPSATSATRQDCIAIYCGQQGYVVCVLAFGDDVQRLPLDDIVGTDIDLSNVRSRLGQVGVLYWDEHSSLAVVSHHDTSVPPPFPYDISEVAQDFATMDYVQNAEVSSYVALVLLAHQVQQNETYNTQQPFLGINGVDMAGRPVGPIRLWRWTEADADMRPGNVYIIRGLKVVKETQWSDALYSYAPRDDGRQAVESSFRVAIEDVSHVEGIWAFF